MSEHDQHWLFDSSTRTLKMFVLGGGLSYRCECRDKATGGPEFGHNGRCPRGEFVLGDPIAKDEPAFGPFFIPIEDAPGHSAMADHGRAGIGLHGGGSGLDHPEAPFQGWVPTHGCLRVQNGALLHIVALVNACHAAGGIARLTVTGP